MKTYNRNSTICGTPAWRYIYHTLHSCDRWFINPDDFSEPEIHAQNLDKVDLPCDRVLSDTELWEYYNSVKRKTLSYLEMLNDADLNKKPAGCRFTRLELILGQFRHMYAHIGILNGITITNEDRYPIVIRLDKWKSGQLDDELYDE